MNPGATARPSASIVWLTGPLNLPISTILPFLTPTSPRKAGIPEPSTTRPFLISRSYAIGILLGAVISTSSVTPPAAFTHPTDLESYDYDAGVVIVKRWR